jgi:hypothetical protein
VTVPDTTPLGITYPCATDTIGLSVLQEYAESTQDALDAAQAVVDEALDPPAIYTATDFTGFSIAAGVTTAIPYATARTAYDPTVMFNSASPTILTVTVGGTYLVNLVWTRTSIPAGQTSSRIAILVNGVERAYMKQDMGTAAFIQGTQWYCSALLPSLVPGDQISTTHLFTGAGNMGVRHAIDVTRISDV